MNLTAKIIAKYPKIERKDTQMKDDQEIIFKINMFLHI